MTPDHVDERRSSRRLVAAPAIASALPCAALLWPLAVPHEIVALALTAWIGVFATALATLRAEERRSHPAGARLADRPQPRS
jgi:hypothetical protein